MSNLGVFVYKVLVGTLHDTDPLSFTYTQDCVNGLVNVPFSALIPLEQERIATMAVLSFFENLLPEGDERAHLQERHHVTTVFGLLSKVGGDTAGSLVILPEGQYPQPDDYMPLTWADVGALVNDANADNPAVQAAVETNVSLSGAQRKVLLLIGDEGNPFLPLNASISTHILKPDIKRTDIKVFSSAINETMVMKLSSACELPTAAVIYLPDVKSCLVERFDREKDATGNLTRLYQADLCQLLGKPSTIKYENDGGPSFRECYKLVSEVSAVPIIDCHNMVRWLLFNLLVGNNDSHAKNLSMLKTGGKLRLSPFYDLMCTRVYTGLSKNFAFRIGQHFAPGQIDHQDLCELADSIGINQRFMIKTAIEMANRIEANLQKVAEELLPMTPKGSSEQTLLERATHTIMSNIGKTRARLLPPNPPEVP